MQWRNCFVVPEPLATTPLLPLLLKGRKAPKAKPTSPTKGVPCFSISTMLTALLAGGLFLFKKFPRPQKHP